MNATALLLALCALSDQAVSVKGQIPVRSEIPWTTFHGYLRARGESLTNLDLDRGITPSGDPFYPVPLGDPNGQTLWGADLRVRLDLRFATPGDEIAVVLRTDLLDNLILGSTPVGFPTPAAATTQGSPENVLVVRRAYAEARTPFGMLSVGRMGNHWGLGILTNGGDCDACDFGDAADRIAFATPLFGYVFAASFDFTATGPLARRKQQARVVDIDPSDDVRTVTFAGGDFRTDRARARRNAREGGYTLEYGMYVSHRWQENDVPVDYLPLANPVPINAGQVMVRGYRATGVDGWARFTMKNLRVELEVAGLFAEVDEPSLVPGVLYERAVTSAQLGIALESELTLLDGDLIVGFDAGYASGDPAPGFGAFPRRQTYPRAGDLDGPQAQPPFDLSADNFRFHPDYHIDRILFREIIGAVTDAAYVRPRLSYRLLDVGVSKLTVSLAAIASHAIFATSTPGGQGPLGIELDPSLTYDTPFGFRAGLHYALLFPLAGLDNPALGLGAQPAQLAELRMMFEF